MDGTLATMRPDVEWHAVFELPDLPRGKAVYRGHEEVRQLWDAFRSVWDEITVEITEVLHDEAELLVVRANFHARGGSSGVELDRRIFYLMELDDEGLLRRIRHYESEQEARAAAGLEP